MKVGERAHTMVNKAKHVMPNSKTRRCLDYSSLREVDREGKKCSPKNIPTPTTEEQEAAKGQRVG